MAFALTVSYCSLLLYLLQSQFWSFALAATVKCNYGAGIHCNCNATSDTAAMQFGSPVSALGSPLALEQFN